MRVLAAFKKGFRVNGALYRLVHGDHEHYFYFFAELYRADRRGGVLLDASARCL